MTPPTLFVAWEGAAIWREGQTRGRGSGWPTGNALCPYPELYGHRIAGCGGLENCCGTRRASAKEMQHGAAAASVRPPPWRPAPHLALLPGVDARAVLHASELGGEGQACGSLEGLVVAPGACRDGAQRRTVRVAVTLLAVQRCPCRALQRLARGPVGTPASSRRLASSGLGSSGWTRQTPSAKAAGARRSPSRAGSASDMLWWRGGASRSAGREGGT